MVVMAKGWSQKHTHTHAHMNTHAHTHTQAGTHSHTYTYTCTHGRERMDYQHTGWAENMEHERKKRIRNEACLGHELLIKTPDL